MNLVVVKTSHPFAADVSDQVALLLVEQLNQSGHRAELVKLPYAGVNSESMVKSMIAASMLRMRGVDRIVVHDFPFYYMRHDERVAWLTTTPPVGETGALEQAVANMDARQLAQMRRYAASEQTRADLKARCGLDAELLPVPLADDDAGWSHVVAILTA